MRWVTCAVWLLAAMALAPPDWARPAYAADGPASPVENGAPPPDVRPPAAFASHRAASPMGPMPRMYAQQSLDHLSPLMRGLINGFFGAGLIGLATGWGIFGGLRDMFSLIGFAVQCLLLVLLVRALLGLFSRHQPAAAPANRAAGKTKIFARAPQATPPSGPPITLSRSDYEQFERLLHEVQAAWTAGDGDRMRQIAIPSMAAEFGRKRAELARDGYRNSVTEIRLEKGELAEAWAERGLDYATVGMRFSMIDVTRDAHGYVVDGSTTEHVSVDELWTFQRAPGAPWMLSAIQQGR